MPRIYKCRKCGQPHGPPTDKHCRNVVVEEGETSMRELMAVIMEVKNKVDEMDKKASRDDANGAVAAAAEAQVNEEGSERSEEEESVEEEAETTVANYVTPKTIRKDLRAMTKAAERIAKMQDTDSDDDEPEDRHKKRGKGKKSGSMITAAQVVEERIDWPHLHVQRVAGGGRTGVEYKDLRMEEFVYGYLCMLENPKCPWDKDVMLDILKMLMQDTMDYAWENARAFYQLVGVDVEMGVRKWTDSKQIMDMRLLHSRTTMGEKKEVNTKKGNTGRATSAPVKCCALYQRRTCEHGRDHPPFTHACLYCFRATGLTCRHPENDCYRKANDESKNGEKRE